MTYINWWTKMAGNLPWWKVCHLLHFSVVPLCDLSKFAWHSCWFGQIFQVLRCPRQGGGGSQQVLSFHGVPALQRSCQCGLHSVSILCSTIAYNSLLFFRLFGQYTCTCKQAIHMQEGFFNIISLILFTEHPPPHTHTSSPKWLTLIWRLRFEVKLTIWAGQVRLWQALIIHLIFGGI